jgi:hypothetical protein
MREEEEKEEAKGRLESGERKRGEIRGREREKNQFFIFFNSIKSASIGV